MTLADGYYLLDDNDAVYVDGDIVQGQIGGAVDIFRKQGFRFTPAVVLSKEEYDALVANQPAPDAWEPVPDGVHLGEIGEIEIEGDQIWVYGFDDKGRYHASMTLTDGWRLMRPRQKETDNAK